jgi:hypothetical protein
MQSVQIKTGKHKTGIIGLEKVLEQIVREGQQESNQEIAKTMIEKLSKKNYIPSTVVNLYKEAFVREYKKFIGEPIPELSTNGAEIKVLGAGCPTCDKLEQTLMTLIEETGVTADLDHIRDIREISMG